ncbi:(2Fe-2S) ferredoxin domain-containing protein [uncultured Thiodictyon sp.]|uniref:(2Fe-2S) ferredoxin domain-containing protein n=1 Tax=uncultured Thiodictyon sp. TaxID=1846217 RepID=UPI0025F6EE60|nr:(2Fe-2S) ferredoxin domain-containing protein [uncultured Thiodictyon sp.]
MSYYRHHVFFCTNQREEGRRCCGGSGSADLRDYLKRRTKELNLAGPGGVRINTAGCLNRCAEGPVVVVYPEAVWYTYANQDDLDEILTRHLIGGQIVARLRLPG